MHNFHQKSIYLAVALALQAGVVLAEETKPAPAPETQTTEELEEVNVKSKKEAPKDGYQATKTRIGKALQDPHDIPQAVTTVTNQLMHDQQVGSLREALRNVSGLTFNAAEGGRSGDNFMLRGFYTFGDTYLDGIRDTAQYNRETFNLEQVDVLRGSAAMLFGRGQAGGVINQVTKTANANDNSVVAGSLGEYGYGQVTGDFNHTFDETTAVRLNVMQRHEESYRENPANGDSPELGRKGIAGSIGFGIGTDNEFFLNHVYTQTRDVPDYGISFLNKRPIDTTVATGKIDDETFYGGDKTFDDSDTRTTTGIFTHKFSKDTQLRTQLRSASYERAYWAKTPNSAAIPTATLGVGGNATRKSDYDTLTLQSDFSTKFKLADMEHQLLVGFEYLDEDSFRQALRNLGTATNPLYRQSQLVNTAGTNRAFNEFDSVSKSYYVQDTVEFIPDWKLTLGARRDHLDADYLSSVGTTLANASSELKFSESSYRAGLSWQPTDSAHYYVSYTDSFSPTADLYQLSQVEREAERSDTYEIGAKWLFLDGDLAFRTALYSATKDWERNTDLEATAAILTRKRRTNGLDLEVAGKVTDKWEVFGGVSLMDAKILKVATNSDGNDVGTAPDVGDSRFEGERPRNTPSATFNLWTTYKLLGNWKVGGGIEAKGERYGYNPQQQASQTSVAGGVFENGSFKPNTLPGYARVDALVAYEAQRWAVRLNVKNLLDKKYYDALYDNGAFSVPGNRRQAIVTTEFKF
ncbi:MAG: TonB-dependent receptor [Methylotenera sp.]